MERGREILRRVGHCLIKVKTGGRGGAGGTLRVTQLPEKHTGMEGITATTRALIK